MHDTVLSSTGSVWDMVHIRAYESLRHISFQLRVGYVLFAVLARPGLQALAVAGAVADATVLARLRAMRSLALVAAPALGALSWHTRYCYIWNVTRN